MTDKKEINLRDLKEDEGVYVLNETKGERLGTVIFTVPSTRGNSDNMVEIPKSFLAFDLTDQVPFSQLIDSVEFRSSLSSGMLRLVTKKESDSLRGSLGSTEETQRLRELKSRNYLADAKEKEEVKEATLSTSVVYIVSKLEEGELKEGEAIAALRNSDLEDGDIPLLKKKATESEWNKLYTWISNK